MAGGPPPSARAVPGDVEHTAGRTGGTDGAVSLDPFEPGFTSWPYNQYARLRRHDPVHWSDLLEGWVLTRFADATTVLRDPHVSVELENASPTGLVELYRERMRGSGRTSKTVVLLDDPDHNRIRRLLQRPFGLRPIERLREMVTERVDAAMATLVERSSMDVIGDFAYPLPVGVFCEMFGIPDEAAPHFRGWTAAVARNLDPVIDDDEHARCIALMDEMYAYLEDQVEVKRRSPGNDVMTELVQAEEAGDRLSRDELVGQLVTLYVAGHEPTTALVGNGLLALLRQPEQLALLRSRPELLGNAVHELLRFDGPNQFVRRIATRTMVVGDREIAPGDVIYVGIGAANHDPDRWDDPERVHVDRAEAPHHLQFGWGVHSCLGSHLARLQAEIALGALVTRLDDIQLAGDPAWSQRMVLRGLQSLPITYRPAA
jgi:cytochrome P450